jgi:hypothetical protein
LRYEVWIHIEKPQLLQSISHDLYVYGIGEVLVMAFEDWLNRKADHYAHNEILAFLMMILGANFLVGGLVITVVTTGELMTFPFIIHQTLTMASVIGLVLSVTGVFVLLSGFFLVLHYDRKRKWHLGEIEKADKLKNRKIGIAQAGEMLKELQEDA